ncbi:MAG: PhnD/SsuA/transferrin family substrate-binding protein [Desulfobulbaceae bacterium]|nr:PhnD/SsuA/transferrin family substrate-binding protein [Desulfobulbaceae bacterium]
MNLTLPLAVSFFVILLLPAVGAADLASPSPVRKDSEYTITVIPFYSAEKLWTLYVPFVDFLRESTGKPWELKLYASHDKLIEGLCGGKVSLALLGPVPMGRVMEKCDAVPVVLALGKDGSPFYRSVVVTTEPGINRLVELRGKKVGLLKGSSAAHILPRKLLRDAGLDKGDIEPIFYESQEHIVSALLSRQVAGGGLKEGLYNKFKDDGLRVLQVSEPMPNFAFAAAPSLSAATRTLFAEALLRLRPTSNELDGKRMATWDDEVRNGFILPTANFRSSIKEMVFLTNEIMLEDR